MLLLALVGQNAWARPLVENWTSVRALGMGNAYTAVVNDSDALFYNPAGLAQTGGFRWTMFDPRLGANGLSAYETFKDVADSDNFADMINGLYGDTIWLSGGSKTALQFGPFAAAAFAGAEGSAYLRNPAYPAMDVEYAADYGFTAGAGFPLVPGFLNAGVVARRITRVGTSQPIDVSTLATLNTDQLEQEFKNRGSAYGLDLGLTLMSPAPMSPRVSFAWKNVGDTKFKREAGLRAPSTIPDEMVIGAAMSIDLPLVSITPAIDYKYLNREDVQLGKKLHLGVEVDLPLVALRAGLHQGYYALGAGMDLGIMRFDAATYGVEMGEYPGQKPDRRYIVQMTLELGFDGGGFGSSRSGAASGSSGGFSGGRRLKQRR